MIEKLEKRLGGKRLHLIGIGVPAWLVQDVPAKCSMLGVLVEFPKRNVLNKLQRLWKCSSMKAGVVEGKWLLSSFNRV